MPPTPTLVARASSRAVKASESPGSCCRLSAQNHCASGALAQVSSRRNAPASRIGNSSAAPSSRLAITAKPELKALAPDIRRQRRGEGKERETRPAPHEALLRVPPREGLSGGQNRQAKRFPEAGRRRDE